MNALQILPFLVSVLVLGGCASETVSTRLEDLEAEAPVAPTPSAPTTPAPAMALTGNYHFLTPTRVADSRMAFGIDAKIVPGQIKRLSVGDLVLPVAEREGLMLEVTVAETEGVGSIAVYACDDGRPDTVSLNYGASATVSNAVLVGKGKEICFESNQGAHLIVDTVGVLGKGGDSLLTFNPFRLFDSRGTARLLANVESEVNVAGIESIPTNTTGVVLNVTSTGSEETGFLSVYACGQGNNGTSSLSFNATSETSGMVVSRVDPRGKICMMSSVDTDVLIDATAGFLKNGASIRGVKAKRAFDSRSGEKIEGSASIPSILSLGVPASVTSALINIVVTEPDDAGFAVVYECGKPVPQTATVSFAAGQTIANMAATVPSSGGELCIFTSVPTHTVVDLLGYVAL